MRCFVLGLVVLLALAQGLPQHPGFLEVAGGPSGQQLLSQKHVGLENVATPLHLQAGAPSLKVVGLIALAICFIGALCFATVAAPLWHLHFKHQSGWSSGTWFALDSSEADARLSTGIPGMVWLTDKRLFALLMHFNASPGRSSAAPALLREEEDSEYSQVGTGAVESAVLEAARNAGASAKTLADLRSTLRGGGHRSEVESPTETLSFGVPPTCLVQGGGYLELNGASSAGGAPWFLKNANLDSCTDNHCYPSFDECVRQTACTGANRNKRMQAYVVQPHIQRPMLLDGRKFDMRVHVVVVARKRKAESTAPKEDSAGLLQAFLFEEVIVKLARDPWNPEELESSAQHTNMHGAASGSAFHQRLLRNVPRSKEILQACVQATAGCLRAARPLLHHDASVDSRQVLGVDVMVDEDCQPWVLEFNYLPGDDPNCMAPGLYEAAYLPIKTDLPKLASEPLLEGRPAIAMKGWQELHF